MSLSFKVHHLFLTGLLFCSVNDVEHETGQVLQFSLVLGILMFCEESPRIIHP